MAHKDARDNLIQSKQVRKHNYDKNVTEIKYKPNDMLLVKN